MSKAKSNKPKKPTLHQTRVLAQIARSRLIKTHIVTKPVPVWTIDGSGVEISHECAVALIRNGWVLPQRDGLPMMDETQSYTALKAV